MPYTSHDEPVPGYRLIKFLGRGNFGEVWEATSPGGIHVALKVISLGRREGFKEFKALQLFKSIRHPNLTPITAFWLKDEHGFLLDEAQFNPEMTTAAKEQAAVKGTIMAASRSRASELIIALGLGERSISDRLTECQQQGLTGIPPEELFIYMKDAARAIDFLNSPRHDLGRGPISPIQHCDIKPQNILIVSEAAQVCDFGLARELGADVKMTSAAATPAYGAPELLEGSPPSPTTDQYSLAISYVELRTGALPFTDAESYVHVMNAHLEGRLELSGLTPEERAVIEKATSRDPSERYGAALQMVRALERAYRPESESRRGPPRGVEQGSELVPGYRLAGPIFRTPRQSLWEAYGPDRKRFSLLIHDLISAPVDLDAVDALAALPAHPRLFPMLDRWLLDDDFHVIGPEDVVRGAEPARLVILGNRAGETLAKRSIDSFRQTRTGIEPQELLSYFDQAAEALDYLNAPQHTHEGRRVAIMHGNLRPHNLVFDEGQLRLSNFAQSRLMIGESLAVEPGTLDTEPPYAPPEARDSRLARSSDQYALAVCYVQLRTGNQLSGLHGSKPRVLSKSGSYKLLDTSSLNPQEVAAVERAMSLDPAQRFDCCGHFVEQLRAASPAPILQTVPPEITTQHFGGTDVGSQTVSPETRNTPTPGVSDTLINASVVESLVTPKPAPKRRSAGAVLATLLLLGLIGFGAWTLFVGPLLASRQAYDQAVVDLAHADQEQDLVKRVQLLANILALCREHSTQEFRSLEKETERLERTTRETAEQQLRVDLDSAAQLPAAEGQQKLELLERVLAASTAFSKLPGDQDTFEEFGRRAQADLEKLANDRIDHAEQTLDQAPPVVDPAQLGRLSQGLEQTIRGLADGKDTEGPLFRARLAAARARARRGQLPSTRDAAQLSTEFSKLGLLSSQPIAQRYQAQLIVLAALAAEAAHGLPAAFEQLGNLKPTDEPQGLDLRASLPKHGWESDQYTRLIDLGRDSTDEKIAPIVKRLGVIDPRQLAQRTDQLWDAKQWTELDALLNLARADSRDPDQQDELVEWQLLSHVANPQTPAEAVTVALAELKQRLDAGKLRQPPRLGQALILRGHDEAQFDGLVALLKDLRAKADGQAATDLETQLRELYLAALQHKVLAGPQMAAPADYFDALKHLSEQARDNAVDNPLVTAALGESCRELGFDLDVEPLATKLKQLGANEDASPYEKYVRLIARAAPADGDNAELLAVSQSAASDGEGPLAVPYRRQRLAGLLVDASRKLRRGPNEGSTPEQIAAPFGPKENAARAAQAFELLKQATQLTHGAEIADAKLLRNLQINLALAIAHKAGAEAEDGPIQLRELLHLARRGLKPGDTDALALLYADWQSRSDSSAGLAAAAELVAELVSGSRPRGEADAVAIYNQLIAQALSDAQRIEDKDPRYTESLAQLYADKARFLLKYPNALWSIADPRAEALQAAESAVKLVASPDNLAELAIARLAQKKLDPRAVDQALADADLAIKQDLLLDKAHAARGRALATKAHFDRQNAASLFASAVEANQQAVKRAKNDARRFVDLLELSGTYLRWAAALPGAERPAKIADARAAVEAAQKVNGDNLPDGAFTKLGDAYEALSHASAAQPQEAFAFQDEAIACYDKAVKRRGNAAGPSLYLDLARAKFRRAVESGQQDKAFLIQEALAELQRAEAIDKKNAAVEHWLGKVYLYLAQQQDPRKTGPEGWKMVDAEQHLAAAVNLARGSSEFPQIALEWATARLKDPTVAPDKHQQRLRDLIATADVDAPGNRAYRNRLYTLLADSYRAANPKLAYDFYGEALGNDLSQAGEADVELLQNRALLPLVARNALVRQGNFAVYETATADAERALQILQSRATLNDYNLLFRVRMAHATAVYSQRGPQAKRDAQPLLRAAVGVFEKMLAAHLQPPWESYYQYSQALWMLNQDTAAASRAELAKADAAIDKAIQLATDEQETQSLNDMKLFKARLETTLKSATQ